MTAASPGSRRVAGLLAGLACVGAFGAGCGADAPAGSPMTVRLLVRDINIRPAGVDCAGSGAYLYVHRSAPYQVTDRDGAVLHRGELPAGTAVPAFEEDLEVERIPTYCAFAIPVSVPERGGYRLVIDGRPPIELTTDRENPEGPSLVAVIP
ncbi:hypothetical protein SAMN05444365_10841 [Micromonospora pattaloongensis]|uniref:Lipoprotein n=1 Tax=Micromonospora pattaloongensis TaxID=405436 RepID=A0A1H3RGX1_9ACTN|nr:hypothetical protein [Micromonospora pattaloongensis]SDZ24823.1 hypothetical protein SAMN05444365_10841 [Micromonospora pattaloongensis]